MKGIKVYLGADHRGFFLKEKVFEWLTKKGFLVEDFGAYEYDEKDDYTLYAEKVASVVGSMSEDISQSKKKKVYGILFCGSGVGMCVVANKFDGVRASVAKTPLQVRAGRRDDDMNILVIASDFSKEDEVKEMVKEFLETDFSGDVRHEKRLLDIKRIEANN